MNAVYQNMLNKLTVKADWQAWPVDFLPLEDRSLWVLYDQYEGDW